MSEFRAKSLCILGRQPKLGLAELESLYGADRIRPLPNAALLDIPTEEINFQRLGGTIKTARILTELTYSGWDRLIKYLTENTPEHLKYLPDGKLTLGLSVYGVNVKPSQINRSMLEIKKIVKSSGRAIRVIPNKTPELSSAQVLHNHLTHRGGWELLMVANGSRTFLAQTLFVQDIEAYSGRDHARPARDPRVGMLPPKLAQIIINLATPIIATNTQKRRVRILDPFCGTGVILQEALLMNYDVIGTDIDKRMVEYATKNIQWLVQKYPKISGHTAIEIADATTYHWPRFTVIASELYLGEPLNKFPDEATFTKIQTDVGGIIEKFLLNLAPQLKSKQKICLALPAWRKPNRKIARLPLLAKLTDMGYNFVKFQHVSQGDLTYFRENQIVARQLVVLEKK